MKRCEAGKRREINVTITQAFATCTTLALQFYSNDVRVAEVPETGEHPRDFHISEQNLDLLSHLTDTEPHCVQVSRLISMRA